VIDQAVQLHGGDGVRSGHPVEALYREIRALRIYEGASDVQKIVIALGRRAPSSAKKPGEQAGGRGGSEPPAGKRPQAFARRKSPCAHRALRPAPKGASRSAPPRPAAR
jgi:hypothetical protein